MLRRRNKAQEEPIRLEVKLKPSDLVVVLVTPQGDANVGAVARSMSCFGVRELVLVSPRRPPGEETYNWAVHGKKVLDRCRTVATLGEALTDVNLSLGLTRRSGKRRHRLSSSRAAAERILPRYLPARVALVFGNEESGLSRADLDLCHRRVQIPTHPEHGSLNLAHAVTVMLYELLGRGRPTASFKAARPASPSARAGMLAEIRAGLSATGYPAHGDPLEEEMGKLSDILNRAALEDWEVNFLLGIVHHLKSRAVNLSQIRQVGTEQEANSGQLSEA